LLIRLIQFAFIKKKRKRVITNDRIMNVTPKFAAKGYASPAAGYALVPTYGAGLGR
jgi:hypothetical protein